MVGESLCSPHLLSSLGAEGQRGSQRALQPLNTRGRLRAPNHSTKALVSKKGPLWSLGPHLFGTKALCGGAELPSALLSELKTLFSGAAAFLGRKLPDTFSLELQVLFWR